jgi:hypothetical protein
LLALLQQCVVFVAGDARIEVLRQNVHLCAAYGSIQVR